MIEGILDLFKRRSKEKKMTSYGNHEERYKGMFYCRYDRMFHDTNKFPIPNCQYCEDRDIHRPDIDLNLP